MFACVDVTKVRECHSCLAVTAVDYIPYREADDRYETGPTSASNNLDIVLLWSQALPLLILFHPFFKLAHPALEVADVAVLYQGIYTTED